MESLWERCTVLMAWCSESKACSSILDFLHRLNNRAGSAHAHEKRIALVSSGQYTRSYLFFRCIFCEVRTDGADAFYFIVGCFTDFDYVLLHCEVRVKDKP